MQTNKILNGQINFPICLAPMVGLSHVVLREILRDYLPEDARTIWPTEMLNSRRLPYEVLGQTPETIKTKRDCFIVPQILGNEEYEIEKSVQKLVEWGAVGIDINMGCPVQKALKHNYGVALMGDPNYAADVVKMTVRHSQVPVSVKLRAVEKNETSQLFHFVDLLVDAGASWICLHPRTAEQKRRGTADWTQIYQLKRHLNVPVIGNGDIQSADDVFRMIEETNADMVMSGRALAARPWLFWQIAEKLNFNCPEAMSGRRAPRGPYEEAQEYGRMLIRFVRLSRLYFGESMGLRKIRFFVRTTCCWIDFGQSLYSLVSKLQNTEEIENALLDFFQQEIRMFERTDLRQ